MHPIRFFIDFDGTITKSDVVDMILERFGQSEWTEVEKEWISGKIGSRECLARQMALVTVSKEEFKKFIQGIEIDPHFGDFLRRAQALSIPVSIVSDGFKVVIHEVLKQAFDGEPALLERLPVFANDLVWTGNNVKAIFKEGPLCEHRCANCKPRVIVATALKGERILFVGDGLSDRFAAKASDLTFAKAKLLKFCEENKINHKKYSNFKEIEEWLITESNHILRSRDAVI